MYAEEGAVVKKDTSSLLVTGKIYICFLHTVLGCRRVLTMRTLMKNSCCLQLMRDCFMRSTGGSPGGGCGESMMCRRTAECVCVGRRRRRRRKRRRRRRKRRRRRRNNNNHYNIAHAQTCTPRSSCCMLIHVTSSSS